ncbi:ATP-binding cassette domain-containing protein [Tabrizicola sp. WMC-M-20]|nr:ATP-binding cassette domain-containing protein [Tabrizicola sp. WMC-M-20]
MLRIADLSLAFWPVGGVPEPVLSGINLTVSQGEGVGLVGGSGAGKSLIAQAIVNTVPVTARMTGQITLEGGPVTAGRLALVPQSVDALDPLANVGHQIARFARLVARKADPVSVLDRVGLRPDVAALYPHQLSGGMAKTVLLAIALAQDPDFLIADEPTLGLDPHAADGLMACLSGLIAAGKGLLVISHDLPRLVAITRRVIVLQEGHAVETAAATAFSGAGAGLAHPFSRALWRAQYGEIAWA